MQTKTKYGYIAKKIIFSTLILTGFLTSNTFAEKLTNDIPSTTRPPIDYAPVESTEEKNVNLNEDTTNTGTTGWIQSLISKVNAENYVLNNDKVLLIQDYLPWQSNANMEELNRLGIPYDSINSNALPDINLDNYKAIIITSDQPAGFYDIIRQNKTRWDIFVEKGGLLISHSGDHGWQNGDSNGVLPGGVTKTNYYSQPLWMRDINHPVIVGQASSNSNISSQNPWYFNWWYYSTHGYFNNLPEGYTDVMDINSTFFPTYIDYTYGKGRVLATMQTLEYGYKYLGKQEILRNEFLIVKDYKRPSLSTNIPDFPVGTTLGTSYSYNNTNIGIPSTPTYIPDAGDPVNIANGDFGYSNTLLSHKGLGINYDFKIKYSNQVDYEGNLGHNWSHNYNLMVYPGNSGNLIFLDESFAPREFTLISDGLYENKSLRARLTVENNLSTISFDSGKTYSFNDAGKISKIADKNGNNLTFQYDEEKRLIKTIDTLGREIGYVYNADSRLQGVVDFTGKKIVFEYSETDDLTTIKIGNDVNPRSISFEYITGNANTKLNHNITKLIDSKNQAYVENTYDENDRVSIQKYGDGEVRYGYTIDPVTQRVVKNSVENRNGVKTEYNFDEKGNVLSRKVQTATGVIEFIFEYDSNGRITKDTKPNGNSTENTYDDKGRLLIEKKIGEGARVTQYEYSADYDTPTKITTINGLVIENTLDDKGNVIKTVIDPTGTKLETSYEYDSKGQLTKTIDPRGLQTTIEYIDGNIVKITKKDSSLLSILSTGIVTQFTYDADGNPTTIRDGNGNTKSITYDEFHQITKTLSSEGITRFFEYDKNGKETKQILTQSDGTPLETTKSYDILDHLAEVNQQIIPGKTANIQYEYDGNENIKKITYPNGTTKEFFYNEQDKVTKTIIAGQETKYQYDNNGNIVKITDPKGNTQDIQYNLFDEPIKVTDSKGTYTLFTYDTAGNITTSQVFDVNNILLSKQSREYDIFSHLVKQIGYSVTGNDIITTKYIYEKGLLIEKIDPKGNSTKLNYDIYGRAMDTTDSIGNKQVFAYDNNGNIISKKLVQSNGNTTETKYIYDRDNRLALSSVIGEGIPAIETKYTYNTLNQIVETIDGNGNHTKYTYDGLGNILIKTETVDGKEMKTSYEYDSMGNVTSLTDANGNKTTYEYDSLNRRIKEVLLDGSTTTYTYDANENLTSYTDPNGTTVTNSYDVLNRLTKRSITRGANVLGVTEETYSYDTLGRLIGGNDDQNNLLAFEYDGLNNLLKETNNGKSVSYGYDVNNNLTSLTAPSGKKADRTYDALNRITEISLDGKNIASYGYNSLTLDTLTLANGAKTTYGYDSLLRLEELTNIGKEEVRKGKNTTTQDIMINTYAFSYDSIGNITSNGQDTYGYDALSRLTNVTTSNPIFRQDDRHNAQVSTLYNYDNLGNRDSVEQTTIWDTKKGKEKEKTRIADYVNNNLNQYTSITQSKAKKIGFKYDKNGNLTDDGKQRYAYDYRNRLVKVTNKDGEIKAEFGYDILGRRITKTTYDDDEVKKIIRYTYSNQDAVQEDTYSVREGKEKLKNTKEYIYGKGIDDVLVMVLTTTDGKKKIENSYFYQKDQLGSITAITDKDGKVIKQYRYDAFGKVYEKKDRNDSWKEYNRGDIDNTRLFTGREYDKEIGLYYYRARYYSAELGRFINRDPIGMVDDINLYSYVGNNPVKFVDAMGKEKKLFVRAYDAYRGLKDEIYNFNGDYDLGFLLLDQDEQISLLSAYSQVTGVARELHYNRNSLNINLPGSIQEATNWGWTQPELLWSTYLGSYYHQDPNIFGEELKFISPDGHREIVFTINSIIVNSDKYMGTYNFFSPDEKILHTTYDVDPYNEWGNTINDKNY